MTCLSEKPRVMYTNFNTACFRGKKQVYCDLASFYISSAFFYANCILRQVPLVEAKWLLTMSYLHPHNLTTMVETSSNNSDTDSHWSKLDHMLIPEPITISLFG